MGKEAKRAPKGTAAAARRQRREAREAAQEQERAARSGCEAQEQCARGQLHIAGAELDSRCGIEAQAERDWGPLQIAQEERLSRSQEARGEDAVRERWLQLERDERQRQRQREAERVQRQREVEERRRREQEERLRLRREMDRRDEEDRRDRLLLQMPQSILRQVSTAEQAAKCLVELACRPAAVQLSREALEEPVRLAPGNRGYNQDLAFKALARAIQDTGARIVVSGLSQATQGLAPGMAEHGCCSSYSTHMLGAQEGRKPVSYDYEVRLDDDLGNYPFGSPERQSMEEQFRREAAQALRCSPARVVITRVERGSVKVHFTVRDLSPAELQAMDKDAVTAAFKQQWQGRFLSADIHAIFIVCCVSPNDLDPKYNFDWTQNASTQQRGGMAYHQPQGYQGYAVKVLGKYDGGNDDWLMMDGRPGEWAVAFHGTKRDGLKGVAQSGWVLHPGPGQGHKQTCGVGVYCTPDMSTAEGYSGVTVGTTQGQKKVWVAFQCRVRPSAIRQANSTVWVINNPADMRPYRVCVKTN
eukprot:TRINITY_DN21_c0_g5_i1.p1 TRINITY_DN21_c0_g5~~TRINITY_DN21_c0_g5_i1.p1  ORF type:complete len:569 (+),score=175.72 TRINITY_DN21_c0_g5_i1:118-1707(+)